MLRERIIVLAKTYPDVSSKYGYLVCVAGVNEYGEWRRLYPIPLDIWIKDEYEDIRFQKWDVIEVPLEKPRHKDPRLESRRVYDWRKIKVVDHIKDWGTRLWIIKKLLDKDVESIWHSNRSLGLIRPRRAEDFMIKERRRLRDPGERLVLEKMMGSLTLLEYVEMKDRSLLEEVYSPDIKVEEIPWIGYKYYCENPGCSGHQMMVIDWEAQELFRKYKTLGPVREKLFRWMLRERQLYFVIGNTWKYHKSFMIISILYPPKNAKPIQPLVPIFKERPKQISVNSFFGDKSV